MNNNDIQASINNKQLEVKNTVYLNKERVEKLQKYNFDKIIIVLFIVICLLAIFNYFNNFIGLPFIILIIFCTLLIFSIAINFYIKHEIKKLNYQIKNLELYFSELNEKKNITKG